MNKTIIPAFVLSLLFFCHLVSAQGITVSKDSIQVYNNPIMSFADGVSFTSHTSSHVRLDSAIIVVSEMDTVGFSYAISHNGLEVGWRTNTPSVQMFIWTMDSAGPNTYRLVKELFDPASAEPLVLSGNDTTAQIFAPEIGLYLFGQIMPEYPRYIRGAMSLFFSNGQVVELKLRSQDLRTGVKAKNFSTTQLLNSSTSSRSSAFSYRCLANGRRVVANNQALLRGSQISGIKLFERKD